VALKSDFDSKSFRIVLLRALVGALIGAIPGTIYILRTGQTLSANQFGVILIETGSTIGALVFGLAALAGVLVAATKYRGTTSSKSKRLSEYLNPDMLPVIPPSSKKADKAPQQTEVAQPTHVENQVTHTEKKSESLTPVAAAPERAEFEDFDRS